MDKSCWKKFYYRYYDDAHERFWGCILAVSEAHVRKHFELCGWCYSPIQLKITPAPTDAFIDGEASPFLKEAEPEKYENIS